MAMGYSLPRTSWALTAIRVSAGSTALSAVPGPIVGAGLPGLMADLRQLLSHLGPEAHAQAEAGLNCQLSVHVANVLALSASTFASD